MLTCFTPEVAPSFKTLKKKQWLQKEQTVPDKKVN